MVIKMKEIKVKLENASIKEYYELEKILKINGIETKIVLNESDGTEMGFGFNELIILLPLLTPLAVQVRKAFEAYLIYKKPVKQKVSVVLEKKDKKLKIDSENSQLPDIATFSAFFDED